MTREQLVEAAKAKAAAMGWDAIAEDEGSIVTMLLSAEGASDQMVIAPLSRLGAELAAVGDPAGYPAIEEYDIIPEPPLVEQDGSWTEEAERLASPGELPAGPDGEGSPDIEPPQEEDKEVVEMSASLKELYRALMGHTDQDTGGIPRPGAKALSLHKDPESAYHRPVAVRTSFVFYVQGLNPKARTLKSYAFSSGVYRDLTKAKRGHDGAIAAGLKKVRVVRLRA